jgi:hypothetical protein
VQTLPSHKLLDLSYQVASRLGTMEGCESFRDLLHHLLTRLATEHPHHVLLHLFSIRAQSQTDKSRAAAGILQVHTPPLTVLDVCLFSNTELHVQFLVHCVLNLLKFPCIGILLATRLRGRSHGMYTCLAASFGLCLKPPYVELDGTRATKRVRCENAQSIYLSAFCSSSLARAFSSELWENIQP